MRTLTILLALALTAPFLPAQANAPTTHHVGVGFDHETISDAVAAAAPGDEVVVHPGVYQEAVVITTPGITLRGTDRLGVVLDGAGIYSVGVQVFADDVTVRTMTATRYLAHGFVFSDVTGFTLTDLYAKDNGEYGLYVIRSALGEISYSYAEGHGDSGFYIGETVRCDCDVHHNVGWNNMLGYSGTANSYVRIWANEFYDNRAGILPNVLPQEFGYDEAREDVHGFQVGTEIYGNYVHDNNNADSPETGIWTTVHVPVGQGISIAGGWNNHVRDNVLVNNALWGIGLFWLTTPERGNVIEDNHITGGQYGIWWDEWGEDNCFEANVVVDAETASSPADLPGCESLVAPIPCPPEVRKWSACRGSDVRAPSALKDAELAWRAVTDAPPDEDLL